MSSELQLDVRCLSCCGGESGERHEEKAGMVPWPKKRFLSLLFLARLASRHGRERSNTC